MAISIPLSVLLLLLLLLLLICLCCPAWLASCASICRRDKKEERVEERHLPSGDPVMSPTDRTMMMAPPPPAVVPQPYRPYEAVGGDGVYEVTSDSLSNVSSVPPLHGERQPAFAAPSSSASGGAAAAGDTYEAVVYTRPKPSLPDPDPVTKPRTAQKISNVSSVSFFNRHKGGGGASS